MYIIQDFLPANWKEASVSVDYCEISLVYSVGKDMRRSKVDLTSKITPSQYGFITNRSVTA